MRLGIALGRDGLQTFAAHRRQVHADRQRAERLIGADVAGRFFTSDVLLTSLQRQYIAGLAVMIGRLSDDPSRKASLQRVDAGHKPEVRSSEGGSHSQRLTFTDREIRAVFSRRLHGAQGDRIHGHDEAAILDRMRDLPDLRSRFQTAVVVWMLDQYAAGVVCHQGCQGVNIRYAVLFRNDSKLHFIAETVRFDDFHHRWLDRSGNQSFLGFAASACCDGLARCGTAVINGGVGNIHAGQVADHRLVFEDGLQHALADLSLIRCVGGLQSLV